MGEMIELTAEDGHSFAAYRAEPEGQPRGAVIVMQEIFGVNNHIKGDTDKFAQHGYVAIAPAVFDRIETDVALGYDEVGIEKGRSLVGGLGWDGPIMDVKACAKAIESAGKVLGVGYCWGGSLAWLAATRLGIPSAGYYGGRTASLIDEVPKAPVILHFGEKDHAIPLSDVAKIQEAHPYVPVHIYDAEHGFNCDARASYNAVAAEHALARTLAFFDAVA
jgi:carboxymethylenebutenolidase